MKVVYSVLFAAVLLVAACATTENKSADNTGENQPTRQSSNDPTEANRRL